MSTRTLIWNFARASDSTTDLYVYDEIANEQSLKWDGEDWEKGNEVTANQFMKQLAEVTTPNIVVHINSAGGEIFVATAIGRAIKAARERHKITCQVDGVCASAAMTVALACESVAIPRNAYMMIHNASQVLCGSYTAEDCEKKAVMLHTINKGLVAAYAEKTNLKENDIVSMMQRETWMDGAEAVRLGFADTILMDDVDMQVSRDTINNLVRINGAMVATADFEKAPVLLKNLMQKGKSEVSIQNSTDLERAYPELVEMLKREAAESERKRIQGLDSIANSIPLDMLTEAKYVSHKPAEEVLMAAVQTGRMVNHSYLNNVMGDAQQVNAVSGFANSGNANPMPEEQMEKQKVENMAKSVWESIAGK